MKKEEVELQILTLSYSRHVSRAHTIFSSFWDIFFGILVGFLGLVLGLYEIDALNFNLLTFLILIILLLVIIGLVAFIAIYSWFRSQIERKNIVRKMKALIVKETKKTKP